MSTRTKILCIATFAIFILGGFWFYISRTPSQAFASKTPVSETVPGSGSELIAGYRQWTKVNPVPAIFHSQIATLCADVRATQSRMETGNPHRDKFITVFVNDVGRHAMMEEKVPRFPQGSIIVKEKLSTKESTEPELLTVMTKREPGFNPDNGDWEYMALDGTGKSVQARGQLRHCQACHETVKQTDYVSRNYVPYEIWTKWK